MKNENVILLVSVAAAVFLWLNRKAVKAVVSGATSITNTAGAGQPGYGWQYFSDGTAIDPNGTYYKNGVKIWAPASAYDGVIVGASYLNLDAGPAGIEI